MEKFLMAQFLSEIKALFQDAHKNEKFYNTFKTLKLGDHYLQLNLLTLYAEYYDPKILLYYMYDNMFIEDRKEFFNIRKSFDPDISMGISMLHDDYELIQHNLMVETEHCEEITDLLWKTSQSSELMHPSIEYIFYGNSIVSHEVDGSYADYNKDNITINVRNDLFPTTPNLLDEVWVKRLNNDAKSQLKSFLKQNELIDYKKNEGIDLSSLLLPLIKAIEIEFRHHYIYNIEDIIISATKILSASAKWNNRSKKKLGLLLNACDKIVKEKDHLEIGGFRWIYNVLYHIALCKELPIGTPSVTYLNEKQIIELKRYETIIKNVEKDGEDRNRLIHKDFIRSTTIFERLLIHFKTILEALSIMKEYDDLD